MLGIAFIVDYFGKYHTRVFKLGISPGLVSTLTTTQFCYAISTVTTET